MSSLELTEAQQSQRNPAKMYMLLVKIICVIAAAAGFQIILPSKCLIQRSQKMYIYVKLGALDMAYIGKNEKSEV